MISGNTTGAVVKADAYLHTLDISLFTPTQLMHRPLFFIPTERPDRILYRNDLKTFKLYHMLSTYVLHM